MDYLILTLGWVGIVAPLAFGAMGSVVGSAVAVGRCDGDVLHRRTVDHVARPAPGAVAIVDHGAR